MTSKMKTLSSVKTFTLKSVDTIPLIAAETRVEFENLLASVPMLYRNQVDILYVIPATAMARAMYNEMSKNTDLLLLQQQMHYPVISATVYIFRVLQTYTRIGQAQRYLSPKRYESPVAKEN
jgi:hypothetical protein